MLKARLSETSHLLLFEPKRKFEKLVLKSLGARDRRGVYQLPNLKFNRYFLSQSIDYSIESRPTVRATDAFIKDQWRKILDPVQIEGLLFLVNSGLPGAYLAWEPRSGKAIVSFAAIDSLELENVLIVCPDPPVPQTWVERGANWLGRRVANCYAKPAEDGICVTTYRTLMKLETRQTYMRDWDLIIFDEIHRAKNKNTKTFKACKDIRPYAPRAWGLSGSPISHTVADLWAQFRLLWLQGFPSYWRFANQFCIVEETIFGSNVIGTKSHLDLPSLFSDIASIRSLSEFTTIEASLPTIHRLYVEMGVEQKLLYRSMLHQFIVHLDTGSVSAKNQLSQMIRLLQIVSAPSNLGGIESSAKHDFLVNELCYNRRVLPLPAVIWVYWRPGAEDLIERLRDGNLRVGAVLGGWEGTELDDFREGELDVLVIGLSTSARFGIDLSHAKSVIYLDRTFNVEQVLQSLYRTRTLGKESQATVHSLIVDNSVDLLVNQNLSAKAVELGQLGSRDLVELLQGLTGD